MLVLEICPGISRASGRGEMRMLRAGWSREEGPGWSGSGAPAGLQSDGWSAPLAAPLSGITGDKVELMLMVYDTNSF